jgi:hypothetical protein
MQAGQAVQSGKIGFGWAQGEADKPADAERVAGADLRDASSTGAAEDEPAQARKQTLEQKTALASAEAKDWEQA